jgi:hypothetical protein
LENVATFSFSDGSSIEIDRNSTISGMLKCGNFSDKMCPDISYRGKSSNIRNAGKPRLGTACKLFRQVIAEEQTGNESFRNLRNVLDSTDIQCRCVLKLKIPIMFSDPEQPSAELKGRATRNPLAISFLGIYRVTKTATLISIKGLEHSYLQVTLHVSETLANSPWTNVRKGQKRVNT